MNELHIESTYWHRMSEEEVEQCIPIGEWRKMQKEIDQHGSIRVEGEIN